MNRRAWKAGRSYAGGFGSRGWWLGFLWGLLLVLLVKGFLQLTLPGARGAERLEVDMAESAPAEHEASVVAPAPTIAPKPGTSNRTELPASSNLGGMDKQYKRLSAYDRLWVSVYLTEDKKIEKMPIELYVRGVLAGEMPVNFQLEALKAQAIAARTFIYRRLLTGDRSGLAPMEGTADVDDTVMNQAYVSLGALLKRWSGSAKEANLQKLNEAVEETKGLIVTYDGVPIQASFFSTSNGYTENASDYWQIDLPYLRSVASPWDKTISPKYRQTVTMKLADVAARLGVKTSEVSSMQTVLTSVGERVKEVRIGSQTFTGREIREKLSLASSDFSWSIDGNEMKITTRGYGHGVGMSQWGANGMAGKGATAQQILAHYYTGTKVEQASGLLD